MIDTTRVNLLSMVGQMKRVASTGGGEYHGPCPLCGGADRFIVQPHYDPPRWSCRQCHAQWSDAIELQQLLTGRSFVEAATSLGLQSQLKRPHHRLTLKPTPPPMPAAAGPAPETVPALDNPEWMERATSFVEWAWRNLFSGSYTEAEQYVLARGIDEVTADLFMLGYNPRDWKLSWGGIDVFLPAGLVIPYLDNFDGTPRKINIRRFAPKAKPKYLQVKGGANWLFNHYAVRHGCITVLLEGEIDAISIAVGANHHRIVPVATGSVTGARWLRWPALLSCAHRVLLAYDDDDAGMEAARWWAKYLPNARRLVPDAHDVNDMLVSGQSILKWIEKGLER